MRRTACLVFVAGALVAPVGAHAAAGRTAATPLTAARVLALFKAQTGAKLSRSTLAAPTAGTTRRSCCRSRSRISAVTGTSRSGSSRSGDQQDVHDLLSDVHTGVLGTHDSSGIYWERASNVYGQTSWLAKKQFGAQIVLWWYGSARKADATFVRLQRVLLSVARS